MTEDLILCIIFTILFILSDFKSEKNSILLKKFYTLNYSSVNFINFVGQ